MAKIGYARVSSAGQNLDVQLEKLKDCNKIFEEKKAGQQINALACLPVWNMFAKAMSWSSLALIAWHDPSPLPNCQRTRKKKGPLKGFGSKH